MPFMCGTHQDGDDEWGLPRLQARSGRLEHLVGIRTGGYRLRCNIAFATEITLLTRTQAMRLQRSLDDMGSVGRTAFTDHAVGDTLDTLAPIGGREEIIQNCSRCDGAQPRNRHEGHRTKAE